MRKLSVAALACVAVASMLALTAGSASAAQSGRKVVKGHTAQGRSIRVAIHKNSIELKHFTIKLSCKGTGPLIDVESGFLPSQLRNNNRIHDHQEGSTDNVYIRGRLFRHHLKGSIRVRDRWGKHSCDSHWVRFSVRR